MRPSRLPIWAVFSLCLAAPAAASLIEPYPYVATSHSGTCYLKMVGSEVTVYKLNNDGSSTELWRTHMTYAYPSELFLAEGGEHLVRFQAWPRGHGLAANDSVLVFYKHGRILKVYASADLVVDASKLEVMSEGLALGRGKPEFLSVDHRFRVGIEGGGEYVFNYDTGEVVASVKDPPQ